MARQLRSSTERLVSVKSPKGLREQVLNLGVWQTLRSPERRSLVNKLAQDEALAGDEDGSSTRADPAVMRRKLKAISDQKARASYLFRKRPQTAYEEARDSIARSCEKKVRSEVKKEIKMEHDGKENVPSLMVKKTIIAEEANRRYELRNRMKTGRPIYKATGLSSNCSVLESNIVSKPGEKRHRESKWERQEVSHLINASGSATLPAECHFGYLRSRVFIKSEPMLEGESSFKIATENCSKRIKLEKLESPVRIKLEPKSPEDASTDVSKETCKRRRSSRIRPRTLTDNPFRHKLRSCSLPVDPTKVKEEPADSVSADRPSTRSRELKPVTQKDEKSKRAGEEKLRNGVSFLPSTCLVVAVEKQSRNLSGSSQKTKIGPERIRRSHTRNRTLDRNLEVIKSRVSQKSVIQRVRRTPRREKSQEQPVEVLKIKEETVDKELMDDFLSPNNFLAEDLVMEYEKRDNSSLGSPEKSVIGQEQPVEVLKIKEETVDKELMDDFSIPNNLLAEGLVIEYEKRDNSSLGSPEKQPIEVLKIKEETVENQQLAVCSSPVNLSAEGLVDEKRDHSSLKSPLKTMVGPQRIRRKHRKENRQEVLEALEMKEEALDNELLDVLCCPGNVPAEDGLNLSFCSLSKLDPSNSQMELDSETMEMMIVDLCANVGVEGFPSEGDLNATHKWEQKFPALMESDLNSLNDQRVPCARLSPSGELGEQFYPNPFYEAPVFQEQTEIKKVEDSSMDSLADEQGAKIAIREVQLQQACPNPYYEPHTALEPETEKVGISCSVLVDLDDCNDEECDLLPAPMTQVNLIEESLEEATEYMIPYVSFEAWDVNTEDVVLKLGSFLSNEGETENAAGVEESCVILPPQLSNTPCDFSDPNTLVLHGDPSFSALEEAGKIWAQAKSMFIQPQEISTLAVQEPDFFYNENSSKAGLVAASLYTSFDDINASATHLEDESNTYFQLEPRKACDSEMSSIAITPKETGHCCESNTCAEQRLIFTENIPDINVSFATQETSCSNFPGSAALEPSCQYEPGSVVQEPSYYNDPRIAVQEPSYCNSQGIAVYEPVCCTDPRIVVQEPSYCNNPSSAARESSCCNEPGSAAQEHSSYKDLGSAVQEPSCYNYQVGAFSFFAEDQLTSYAKEDSVYLANEPVANLLENDASTALQPYEMASFRQMTEDVTNFVLPSFSSAFVKSLDCIYEFELDPTSEESFVEHLPPNKSDSEKSDELVITEIGALSPAPEPFSPIPRDIEDSFYWSPTVRHLDMTPFLKYFNAEKIVKTEDPEVEFFKQMGKCNAIDQAISSEYRERQRLGQVQPDPKWLLDFVHKTKRLQKGLKKGRSSLPMDLSSDEDRPRRKRKRTASRPKRSREQQPRKRQKKSASPLPLPLPSTEQNKVEGGQLPLSSGAIAAAAEIMSDLLAVIIPEDHATVSFETQAEQPTENPTSMVEPAFQKNSPPRSTKNFRAPASRFTSDLVLRKQLRRGCRKINRSDWTELLRLLLNLPTVRATKTQQSFRKLAKIISNARKIGKKKVGFKKLSKLVEKKKLVLAEKTKEGRTGNDVLSRAPGDFVTVLEKNLASHTAESCNFNDVEQPIVSFPDQPEVMEMLQYIINLRTFLGECDEEHVQDTIPAVEKLTGNLATQDTDQDTIPAVEKVTGNLATQDTNQDTITALEKSLIDLPTLDTTQDTIQAVVNCPSALATNGSSEDTIPVVTNPPGHLISPETNLEKLPSRILATQVIKPEKTDSTEPECKDPDSSEAMNPPSIPLHNSLAVANDELPDVEADSARSEVTDFRKEALLENCADLLHLALWSDSHSAAVALLTAMTAISVTPEMPQLAETIPTLAMALESGEESVAESAGFLWKKWRSILAIRGANTMEQLSSAILRLLLDQLPRSSDS